MSSEKFKLFEELTEESSLEKIKEGIRSLGKFTSMDVTIPSENHGVKGCIFRSRLGSSKLIPQSEAEVFINPDFSKISKGRANPEKYPVFYGCSPPIISRPEQSLSMITAIKEGSKIYRQKNELNQFEQGCITRWELTKGLKLLAFVNHDFGGNTNPRIKNFKQFLKDRIWALNISQEEKEERWEVNNLLAELFAKSYNKDDSYENRYNISSYFTKCVLEKTDYDGILYPSVINDGSGINLALSYDAAKSLKLVYSATIVNYTKEGNFVVEFLQQTEDIKNGIISNYENVPPRKI